MDKYKSSIQSNHFYLNLAVVWPDGPFCTGLTINKLKEYFEFLALTNCGIYASCELNALLEFGTMKSLISVTFLPDS